MKNGYIIGESSATFNCINRSFTVAYQGIDGITLHGHVTQLTQNDYQVFVREKGVIIQCKRDEYGILSCQLGRKKNVPWIDGISNAVARTILEQ